MQTGVYRAFLPKPLPPDPPLMMSESLLALLSAADRELGRLDGAIQILPNPDLFVLMFVRREAVLSSQIEGMQSSLRDLLEAEARVHDPKRPADVAEVSNYVAALSEGMAALESRPVSARLLLGLHERLMRGSRGSDLHSGRLRTDQVWIGAPDAPLQQATFVPPPPDRVTGALSELEVAHESSETARRIVALREEARELLLHRLGRAAGNALRLHEQLFRTPIIDVNSAAQSLGITYGAANRLIGALVREGVLAERTGHTRNRRFAYQRYIDLFAD